MRFVSELLPNDVIVDHLQASDYIDLNDLNGSFVAYWVDTGEEVALSMDYLFTGGDYYTLCLYREPSGYLGFFLSPDASSGSTFCITLPFYDI